MTEKQEEKIDRLIEALDRAYHNPGRLMTRAFFMGLVGALGATVGLTIILFIIGSIISLLGGLPLIGSWISELNRFIE